MLLLTTVALGECESLVLVPELVSARVPASRVPLASQEACFWTMFLLGQENQK